MPKDNSFTERQYTVFDHSQPEVRRLWVEEVVNVIKAGGGLVDGVFADRASTQAQGWL